MKIRAIRINITSYCHLGCKYCFYYDSLSLRKDKSSEMSLSELKQVIAYCKREGVEEIILHGGEPTVHSHIDRVIKLLKENGLEITLLTNAIFNPYLLNKHKADFRACVVNYNHPDTYRKDGDWRLLNKNIKRMCDLNFNLILGYNLYEKKPDYKFFINAIRKFKIKKVRWDVARPSGKFKNKYIPLKEVFALSFTIASFMKDCLNAGAYPELDCPLPLCLTTRKEFNFMRRYLFLPMSVCVPTLDIKPGLGILTCPSSFPVKDIKLTDFKSLSQARNFLVSIEDKFKWRHYLFSRCKGCFYWLNKLCEGGCIGHKRTGQNDIINRSDLDTFLSQQNYTKDHSKNKFIFPLELNSNFILFRIFVVLFQLGRFDDALKVFLRIEKQGLEEIEQNYLDFCARRCFEYAEGGVFETTP